MSRQRTLMLVTVVLVLAMAAGVVVWARGGSGGSAAAPRPSVSSAPPLRVVLPGKPGDPALVSDSDRVKAPNGSTYNVIDRTFVQMMIVHHAQAIEMAKLAPGRATDPELRALAARIGAAQGPEVAWMRAWLRDRRLPETDPAHDHAGMPGMQTPADLTALAGLTGAAFDRRFVAMMTAHHRGAMTMAGDVAAGGSDEQLREVANEMSVEQGSEIRRMADLGAS